jgi:hypothetical protein
MGVDRLMLGTMFAALYVGHPYDIDAKENDR